MTVGVPLKFIWRKAHFGQNYIENVWAALENCVLFFVYIFAHPIIWWCEIKTETMHPVLLSVWFDYAQTSNISCTLVGNKNCWSLRCSWSIASRHCSNYIFILDLTPGFNGLGKDNYNKRWNIFKFWDLASLWPPPPPPPPHTHTHTHTHTEANMHFQFCFSCFVWEQNSCLLWENVCDEWGVMHYEVCHISLITHDITHPPAADWYLVSPYSETL